MLEYANLKSSFSLALSLAHVENNATRRRRSSQQEYLNYQDSLTRFRLFMCTVRRGITAVNTHHQHALTRSAPVEHNCGVWSDHTIQRTLTHRYQQQLNQVTARDHTDTGLRVYSSRRKRQLSLSKKCVLHSFCLRLQLHGGVRYCSEEKEQT